MKNIIVIIAVGIMLILTVSLYRKVNDSGQTLTQATTTMGLINQAIQINSDELAGLKSEWRQAQREIRVIHLQIEASEAQIAKLSKQIADIEIPELPEISYVEPEDFEQCKDELNIARNTAENLKVIAEHQKEKITLLSATTDAQKLIIDGQHEIILKQQQQIDNFEDIFKASEKRWRRIATVAVGVGLVIGKII